MLTLKLDNVSLGYGKRTILKDISLQANPGELVGIIGPNGSGKSTLLKSVIRVLKPYSGKIFINGNSLDEMRHKDLAQLVAIVPQNPVLPDLFTAFEVVLLGRTPHLGLLRYESSTDLAIVQKSMEITHTEHLAERRIGEISGGEKQRLVIARALAQEPKILLLDEPTAHLDINYQVETLELVRRLCIEDDLIVLIALHDLNVAVQYCNRLVILNGGVIYSQGTPEAVVNAKTIKDVYGVDVCVLPHPVNKLPATLVVRGNINGGNHSLAPGGRESE
jgi:iron complex transport system ATP-binding protein